MAPPPPPGGSRGSLGHLSQAGQSLSGPGRFWVSVRLLQTLTRVPSEGPSRKAALSPCGLWGTRAVAPPPRPTGCAPPRRPPQAGPGRRAQRWRPQGWAGGPSWAKSPPVSGLTFPPPPLPSGPSQPALEVGVAEGHLDPGGESRAKHPGSLRPRHSASGERGCPQAPLGWPCGIGR